MFLHYIRKDPLYPKKEVHYHHPQRRHHCNNKHHSDLLYDTELSCGWVLLSCGQVDRDIGQDHTHLKQLVQSLIYWVDNIHWILGECEQMSSKTTLTLKLGILSEDMWRHISTLLKVIFRPRRVSATYAGCKKDELGRHYGELESVFDTSVLPERRSPTELLPA